MVDVAARAWRASRNDSLATFLRVHQDTIVNIPEKQGQAKIPRCCIWLCTNA